MARRKPRAALPPQPASPAVETSKLELPPLCHEHESGQYVATFETVRRWLATLPGMIRADSNAACVDAAMAACGCGVRDDQHRADFSRALFRCGYQVERRPIGSGDQFTFILALPEGSA